MDQNEGLTINVGKINFMNNTGKNYYYNLKDKKIFKSWESKLTWLNNNTSAERRN